MDATSYDTPFNISEIEGTDEEPEEVDNSLGRVFETKIKDLESYHFYFLLVGGALMALAKRPIRGHIAI